ncbi:MAG TPA: hypothetical protein VKA46_33685 [Gemmataceae bacterium]|nr:hypothetical protein [Gemmataceae bacterium]
MSDPIEQVSTREQLREARDKHLGALQRLGSYTGSEVSHGQGAPRLVIAYDPLTPEVKRAVLDLLSGYPVDVVERPMARAQAVRPGG